MTEETFEEPDLSMLFTTRGSPCVETIPVYSAGLIQPANQIALNSAVAKINTRSCTSLNINAENNTNASAMEECVSNKLSTSKALNENVHGLKTEKINEGKLPNEKEFF